MNLDHRATVGRARRTAEHLGHLVGLQPHRLAQLAMVVTQAATNVIKHAIDGAILIRPVRAARQGGVEVIATDRGPGIADAQAAVRDCRLTAATPGPLIDPLTWEAAWRDRYSHPGVGTTLAAQIWPDIAPRPHLASGTTRPLTAHLPCGDGYAVQTTARGVRVLLADGLGHGPLAARATTSAIETFNRIPATSPADALTILHQVLRDTRGAAVAIAELDTTTLLIRFAGVGNLTCATISPTGTRRPLRCQPGIVGRHLPTVHEQYTPVTAGDVFIMHSDGVTARWDPLHFPGLFAHAPQLIAATLLHHASTRRDDASVLSIRVPA
ncbi:SpoIIE family protein phosphatase [Dactylosporangium sp. CS-047395]|uniref:SpoIIE family protein phosphatase n=1 Tax=Dactylosporangium sp. CS-047395 TaxID=3239936 RepID=UPI003D8C81AB